MVVWTQWSTSDLYYFHALFLKWRSYQCSMEVSLYTENPMSTVTIVTEEWFQKGDGSEITAMSGLWLEAVQRNSLCMDHLPCAGAFFDPVILSSFFFYDSTHLLSLWPLSAILSDHCHWNNGKGYVMKTMGAYKHKKPLLHPVPSRSFTCQGDRRLSHLLPWWQNNLPSYSGHFLILPAYFKDHIHIQGHRHKI